MTSVLDVSPQTSFHKEPWDPTAELLFREAKKRERRRRTRRLLVGLGVVSVAAAAMAFGIATAGTSAPRSGASPAVLAYNDVKVLTCSGAPVVRPQMLVVSCADANTLLTSTHWSTWSAAGASGTTTFAMNLCTPYCAASPISHFPRSTVTLSAPVSTRRGVYFSRLTVQYLVGTAHKTFNFSWRGEAR